MQQINDKLQKFNPALVGSQLIANDRFDLEASVISSGKKPRGGGPSALARLNDDTLSMMSRDSNISAISRKSALSLVDLDSIASIATKAKKLPGERGLRANAERRMEKAQMTLIEAQLRKLQDTEDLSYSSRAMPADSSSDQIPSTPTSSSRLDSKGR